MSDLFVYDVSSLFSNGQQDSCCSSCRRLLEDTVWDDTCVGDDHIVPHPCSERAGAHTIEGNSRKKPHREVTSISSAQDISAARYCNQGREQSSPFRSTMLEKDSFSHSSSGLLSSSTDIDSIKEASCLASDSTRSSNHGFKSHNSDTNGSQFCADDITMSDKAMAVGNNSFSYSLGDETHPGNNIDFFENTEVKDSCDFLYYGWPEIENFDDVDRMFRSSDSTFGLGASKEDELGWFSSADDIGGPEDVQKLDIRFPSPEYKAAENICENRDSLKSYSSSDSAMTNGPTRCQDSSWASEKSDPYVSFFNGPTMADSKDGLIPKEQINEHKKQFKLQNHSMGKTEEHYFKNDSFSCISSLSNEVMQLSSGPTSHQQQQAPGPEYGYMKNPASYVHSVNSQLSETTLVSPTPSAVKSEANGLTSHSPRDSSHSSSQLTALAGSGKGEMLHHLKGSRSSMNSSKKNLCMTVHASIGDPGSVGKQFHVSGDKFEDHSDVDGASMVVQPRLGSANVQDDSPMSSGLNDISLEAASFRQLQRVMEQLDLKTKLCIRDSLYRLAWSAEQRHKHANLNGSYGDQRDDNRVLMDEGTNNFMDIERDTNPIDRSIAHLLFHRPSESTQDSSHPKAPLMVNGSVAMVEDMAIHEETA